MRQPERSDEVGFCERRPAPAHTAGGSAPLPGTTHMVELRARMVRGCASGHRPPREVTNLAPWPGVFFLALVAGGFGVDSQSGSTTQLRSACKHGCLV